MVGDRWLAVAVSPESLKAPRLFCRLVAGGSGAHLLDGLEWDVDVWAWIGRFVGVRKLRQSVSARSVDRMHATPQPTSLVPKLGCGQFWLVSDMVMMQLV